MTGRSDCVSGAYGNRVSCDRTKACTGAAEPCGIQWRHHSGRPVMPTVLLCWSIQETQFRHDAEPTTARKRRIDTVPTQRGGDRGEPWENPYEEHHHLSRGPSPDWGWRVAVASSSTRGNVVVWGTALVDCVAHGEQGRRGKSPATADTNGLRQKAARRGHRIPSQLRSLPRCSI